MNHPTLPKSVTPLMIFLLVASLMALTSSTVVPVADKATREYEHVSYGPDVKIETSDMQAFAEDLIPRQLAEYHIAGAIVSIVQDGKIELAKGYGYADVAEQTPVTPDETIFRIGSTSKLFTWTAVMQLAEQGKINLDADVNNYLPDFQIPATYPEPITMRHLMSHTSGFEERYMGREARSPEDITSLSEYLANYMPDRVRPAGEMTSYSNYGAALAGYIVETVSGMPFENYIEKHIFEPLSMSHSTFHQPLPSDLESHLSNSYAYNGEFVPGTFSYPILQPAATMCTTANDMANFMIAHLQEGRFGEAQILKPDTARQMHSRIFANDERLDGFAYGFFEGSGLLWHGGDIGYWHSFLVLIPEKNLGFFVSYNSASGIQAVAESVNSFILTFSPPQAADEAAPSEIPYHDLDDLAGDYRTTRYAYNHLDRIAHFTGLNYARVRANPDRTLSVSINGVDYGIYREKGPFVYSSEAGDILTFHQNASGKITHMQNLIDASVAYERIPWFESPAFTVALFAVSLVLLVSTLLAAFFRLFRQRKGEKAASNLPWLARIWVTILSTMFIFTLAVAYYYDRSDLEFAFPTYMLIVLVIILVASILVIGPVIFTVLAWARRYWNLAGRIHYTLVTVALLGMVWLVYYWRLLGFRY